MEVGFDRKINYEWLEIVSTKVRTEKDPKIIYLYLKDYLEKEGLTGDARRKTINVLMKIWVVVPDDFVEIRDNALILLDMANDDERFAIQWTMCCLGYPFFKNIMDSIGRLFALQGDVSLSQIERRIFEIYGQRSTVKRAVQRVVRSVSQWSAIKDTTTNGLYLQTSKKNLSNKCINEWILKATIKMYDIGSLPFDDISRQYFMFPFNLVISQSDIFKSDKFIIQRHGNKDLIFIKK